MSHYPDHANSDLLERIPLSAGVVLDVGCNTGALGAAYRRLNPRALLLGIELDPDAAALATRRLDQVAVVDVEQDPLPFDAGSPDRLHRVRRRPRAPARPVGRCSAARSRRSSDDGTVLICVPNMQHWSFADRLLRGTWKYEPAGLLDETHLRWFSLETMREGLEAVGLVPHDVSPRMFDAEKAQEFAGLIAPALSRLGVDPSIYAQRAAPLQYVWRSLKRPRQTISIVANMLRPVGGVSHVRIVYPLQAMRTDPTVLTSIAAGGEIKAAGGETCRASSSCIVRRCRARQGAAVLRALLSDGWLIVTEFDDHPDHFGMLDAEDQFAFRGVHAVQTSTPALGASRCARAIRRSWCSPT